MRRYVLNVKQRSLHHLAKAVKGLDKLTATVVLDADNGVQYAERMVKVESVRMGDGFIEALVKISYRARAAKYWSDVYLLRLQPGFEGIVVELARCSGLGRTDPDLVVDMLARLLAVTNLRD